MIIKGKSRGNGAQLGRYLITLGSNERIEVVEIRGVVAADVPGALLEMDAAAACSRSSRPLYHASINSRADERLTEEQRTFAINRLEVALGFSGQPCVVVIHEQGGREHCHVVWSRLDLARNAVISDSHNYRKHEAVARELEREFGHERVQGAHAEREGKSRPERTPNRAEMEQGKRTGLSAQHVKEHITGLWRSTATGSAFALALSENGYTLARGDRRDYVLVDPKGEVHSLARRIAGARARDIRARLADLDPASLPSIDEARQLQRKRHVHAAERGNAHPPDVRPEGTKAADAAGIRGGAPPGNAFRDAAGSLSGVRANAMRRSSKNQPPARAAASGRGRHRAPASRQRPQRSANFYAHLNQMPSFVSDRTARRIFEGATGTQVMASGELLGLARWLTASASKDVSQELSSQGRPVTPPGRQEVDADSADASGETDDLGALLSLIAHEIHARAAAARTGVMAEFAGRAAHARKHLSRNLLPGALAAISQSRKAALAVVSRNAALECVSAWKIAPLSQGIGVQN